MLRNRYLCLEYTTGEGPLLSFENKESIIKGSWETFYWVRGFRLLYGMDFKHICLEKLFQGKR